MPWIGDGDDNSGVWSMCVCVCVWVQCWYIGWMIHSLWYRAHVCHRIVLYRNYYDRVHRPASRYSLYSLPLRFAIGHFNFMMAKSSEVENVQLYRTVHSKCFGKMRLLSLSLWFDNKETPTHTQPTKNAEHSTYNCFIGLKFYVQLFH